MGTVQTNYMDLDYNAQGSYQVHNTLICVGC